MTTPQNDRNFHHWQMEALTAVSRCLDFGELNALIVAAVGAGKTWFACHLALMMLRTGRVRRIVVVVPSRHLLRQWAKVMASVGIDLMVVNENHRLKDGLAPDASGYLVTYAGMALWPDLHASFAHAEDTIVIFDEVHHLGDEDHADWGPKARIAFANVRFRLSLSGTPYRSSGMTIPFQTYDPPDAEGKQLLRAVYTYGYGQAVADGICRRVNFKPYDGTIEFKTNGQPISCGFADDLKEPALISARMNAAIQPLTISGERNRLLENIIHDANNRLTDVRNSGHRDAGGFIVCADIEHARVIAKLVEHITGDKPIVATSDDERAPAQIEAFTTGESRWLISVRMISEGNDIPRLRLGIYLSTITEELFFMQVLGRIVRMIRNVLGESYMYLLADDRLVRHATNVEEDVKYWTKQKRAPGGGGGGGGGGLRHGVELIDAAGEERDNVVGGEAFDPIDIRAAEELRSHHPRLYEFSILDIVRFANEVRMTTPAPQREIRPQTYDDRREELGREIDAKIGLLAHITGRPHSHITSDLNRRVGIKHRKEATIPQLIQQVALLRERLVIAENGS